IFYLYLFVEEVTYKIWWYSLGSKRVSYVMAGNIVVGNMVACTLELASDDRKALSSLLVREMLRAYDTLLGNDLMLLLVVACL
ncbi:unnamed protein product, partial [Musa acuminata var. zebrina]